MSDDTTGKTGSARTTRRSMMKKGLALGTVGYVAPMIVGAVTPVSAQGVSNPSPGCVGANCQTFIACVSTNCFCWTLSTGGGFCGLNFLCSSVSDCTGTPLTCPSGFVCAVNTCCVSPKCTPVSSLCTTSPTSFNPPPGSGLSASGTVY